MKKLMPAERLIVSADFKPHSREENTRWSREWIWGKVMTLADSLEGTGVCLKVNSALRICGNELIFAIHERGLGVFADLKLHDISETLVTDAILLRESKPEILTVTCVSGVTGMRVLKEQLPDTEVFGVTVLSSLNDADIHDMFGCTMNNAILRFAKLASIAGLDGIVCPPTKCQLVRKKIHGGLFMSFITPGIRPTWANVPEDDQNPDHIMTPAGAIKAGADRIVVGRPIVLAKNTRYKVMQIIEEITLATA